MALDLRPAPGSAPWMARWSAQAQLEIRLTLRNGEQVLLTLVIPLVLLLVLGGTTLVNLGSGDRVSTALAGVLAVAVLSSAFTGPAIAIGFDRRSGALRLLGTTPLTRTELLAAKAASVLLVEAVQVALLGVVAAALGWSPSGGAGAALALLAVATAAFTALGMALAGSLRAEATLAVANAIFLLLLLGGGTALPTDRLPHAVANVADWLPSGALGNGLRAALAGGNASVWHCLGILAIWGVAGALVAARTFRWD